MAEYNILPIVPICHQLGAILQTKGMVCFDWFWLVFDQIDQ